MRRRRQSRLKLTAKVSLDLIRGQPAKRRISNGESGYGRFDIQLIPKIKSIPGFIFEFKHAKTDSEDLSALAREALTQIIAQKYETQMQSQGVSEIVKIGIAFRGKKASVERG